MNTPRTLLLLLVAGLAACSSSSKGEPLDVAPEVAVDVNWVPPDAAEASSEIAETVPETAPDAVEALPEVASDAVDETPFEYPCEPGALEACVTACVSAGHHRCLKEWGPCVPPDEFCGNCSDDDCDGLINEECPPNPECETPVEKPCPTAVITVDEGTDVGTGTTLHLHGEGSTSPSGAIASYQWTVQAPFGQSAGFVPNAANPTPAYDVQVAGVFLFTLEVTDGAGTKSCLPAQLAVTVKPNPPVTPTAGCADGQREGFVDQATYTHIAGCSGAWDHPGITPDTVVPACNRQGGDDGPHPEGDGCSSADLCAQGWHVCSTWHEVAAKSPTGCAGATPPDAAPKSLFFAIRQPSANGSVCGEWGDGYNDVFGCGNLGNALPADKSCGPLDRVLASTVANSCGFNEAEPNLGPWQCLGDANSHLNEGATVTKKGCPNHGCSYDGQPVGNSDKGGVLCCRD